MNRLLIAGVLAASLGACGREATAPDPVGVGGLAVDSTVPAAGRTDAAFTGPAFIYFDRALDPSTVSGLTAGILLPSGQASPGVVSYDAGRRAIRLDLALVPGLDYTGVATIDVRGASGEGLTANHFWNFRTRVPARTALDAAPASGGSPVLASDGGAGFHAAWVDSVAGAVRYARCSADCGAAASWALATAATGAGPGSRVDLAAAATGAVAIAYYAGATGALAVATCAAGCGSAGAWRTAVVDDPAGDVGFSPSIARGPDGALHVLAQDRGRKGVRYVRCDAGCDTPAGWSAAVALDAGNRGPAMDLAVDPSGRVHAVWVDQATAGVVYASCAAGCAAPGGWAPSLLLITSGAADRVSLVLRGGDRPVMFFGIGDFVAAGLCLGADCREEGAWALVALLTDAFPQGSFGVAVDTAGRVHATYASRTGTLRYVTCQAACEVTSGRWVAGTLGAQDVVDAAVALTPAGVPAALARTRNGGVVFAR